MYEAVKFRYFRSLRYRKVHGFTQEAVKRHSTRFEYYTKLPNAFGLADTHSATPPRLHPHQIPTLALFPASVGL